MRWGPRHVYISARVRWLRSLALSDRQMETTRVKEVAMTMPIAVDMVFIVPISIPLTSLVVPRSSRL